MRAEYHTADRNEGMTAGERWEQSQIDLVADAMEDCPDACPQCGSNLASSSGYVGEEVVYCPNEDCDAGILWEDAADAVRRVI